MVALAFGGAKPKKSNASSKKQSQSQSIDAKDLQEWGKRDEEFVNESYQQQLEEALLASKIDFEANKGLYEMRLKEKEELTKKAKIGMKKNKKGTTMTLDQFNQEVKQNGEDLHQVDPQVAVEPENFFDNVSQEAKKTMKKEQNKVGYKAPKEVHYQHFLPVRGG